MRELFESSSSRLRYMPLVYFGDDISALHQLLFREGFLTEKGPGAEWNDKPYQGMSFRLKNHPL